ncbi:MAG: shikimate dehydrogenase [Actinobacteria bacterium]|nr:shikimate dehydrogenase [Actinomycetota bacterium]
MVGLFGNPAMHSLSPLIHNSFLERTGIDAVYLTFEFSLKSLAEAFLGAKKLGVLGLNITMPFKEHICRLTDSVDPRSAIIGSVNTIKFNSGKRGSMGYNTDVDGFTRSLEENGFDWSGSKCLVIGAGGSAKSSVFALLEKPVKKVYIYNRTTIKAEEIRNSYPMEKRIKIEVLDRLEEINPADMGLICNCTPLGMENSNLSDMMPVPDKWDLRDIFLFEMVYKPLNTRLLEKGKNEGARVIDGLDMLINQAASSFKIWFDVLPETNGIKKDLIDYLNIKN